MPGLSCLSKLKLKMNIRESSIYVEEATPDLNHWRLAYHFEDMHHWINDIL